MTISRAALLVLACSAVCSQALAQERKIHWHDRPLVETLAESARSKRPVLLYFWMDGSQHCADLWNQTLTQADAAKDLAAFVCHSAKATTKLGRQLVQRYNISTLPSLLVLTADGTVDDAVLGFIPLATFGTEMRRALSGNQTVRSLRAAADADPKHLGKRFALAQKLVFVGEQSAGNALLASIRAEDPEGKTMAGAELLLFGLRKQIVDAAPSASDSMTWNLRPMYSRLTRTRQASVLFKGYSWLASIEYDRGDRKKQRAAWRAAWPHAPKALASEWGGDVLLMYWNQREDALSSKDRSLARAIANYLLAEVEGDNSQATEKVRAFQLQCAACGLAVAGKLAQARKVIARAVEIQPANGELVALAEQMSK